MKIQIERRTDNRRLFLVYDNLRSTERMEWNGREMTRYEASQWMRRKETQIRAAKDERYALETAGDKVRAARAGRRSAALGREYRAFCAKAGLTPRNERARSMTGAAV